MSSPDAPHTESARRYLFSLEQIGIKLGLEQITALLDAIGRPDRALPSIVIAGTNGKGSTTAMVERGLRAAGYRTGRYTSPHLVAIEERFAIDGTPIDAGAFDEAAERVRGASRQLPFPPSFFEATTALALDAFREARVDVAVLEVGLGGRLDATNAVSARAAVITRVDFDHEQFLGSTLEAIAVEKAGVIKTGQIVVLADNPRAVSDVVERTAQERGATLVRSREGVELAVSTSEGRTTIDLGTPTRRYGRVPLGLRGRHQVDNALAAVCLLEAVDAAGLLSVSASAVRTALEHVVWPGRLELISTPQGAVLLDGAHNPSGAEALARYIAETFGRRVPLVVGIMADKKLDGIIAALTDVVSSIIATAAESPRAASPELIADVVTRVAPDVPVSTEPSPIRAVERALRADDVVVVAGSLYLVGEIRALL